MVEFEAAPLPYADKRVKHNRYNKSERGRERYSKGNEHARERRLEEYLSRPFVAWDGEGINEPDGSHTYVLLANSLGKSIESRVGLGTKAVFEFMLSTPKGVTNVIYGGGYDINMILRDVDVDTLKKIYEDGSAWWEGYWIEWRGTKSLRVKRDKLTFTLFDVLPFFQCPFVKACDEYLGTDWEHRDEIIRQKAARGSFDYAEIRGISEYNRAELSTLVRLCDELRSRLYKVDIRVSRWDGPGAIAASLYQRHQTKSHKGEIPIDVSARGRYAYAGGRFEIIRKGHSTRGAYQYDIRSAYPAAIRKLPCLAHGEWSYVLAPQRVADFGVYHIEISKAPTMNQTQPQPLWRRNVDGTVYFSRYPIGEYWTPEAQLALDLGIPIADGWEYHTSCECAPFAFVEPMYNKRAALKKAGDGAHVGLKLGLNSLYGKLAQQIGWQPGPPLRLPPYHCLEWAGYVTSHCRAQVYRAAMLAIDDVIAFETDAVFTRVPLPVKLGTALGEWEATEYESLTYLKSGMYFGTLRDGREVEKLRGINRGTLTRDAMIAALERDARGERVTLQAEQTRFIGLGLAMSQDMGKWRRWITSPREIKVWLNGKRIDLLDKRDIWADYGDGWQETQIGVAHTDEHSHPYEVEWINPDSGIVSPSGETLMDVRKRAAMELWEWDN